MSFIHYSIPIYSVIWLEIKQFKCILKREMSSQNSLYLSSSICLKVVACMLLSEDSQNGIINEWILSRIQVLIENQIKNIVNFIRILLKTRYSQIQMLKKKSFFIFHVSLGDFHSEVNFQFILIVLNYSE